MDKKWIAAILSAVLPGLGQFVYDRPFRGVCWFILAVMATALSFLTFIPFGAVVWVVNVLDAYMIGENKDLHWT